MRLISDHALIRIESRYESVVTSVRVIIQITGKITTLYGWGGSSIFRGVCYMGVLYGLALVYTGLRGTSR
jgi:hypothetical protein